MVSSAMAKRRQTRRAVRGLPEPDPQEVWDEVIRIEDRCELKTVMQLGAYLADRFLNPRFEHNHEEYIADICRRLSDVPNPPYREDELRRIFGIYMVVSRTTGRERFARLGARHYEAVVDIPEPDQERLLAEAQLGNWTVERLVDEIAKTWPRPNVWPPMIARGENEDEGEPPR